MLCIAVLALVASFASAQVGCPTTGASGIYSSTPAGGFRFAHAFDPSARVFKLKAANHTTTLDAFRCTCLNACSANTSCINAFILSHGIEYTCYGLNHPSMPIASKIVSESWDFGSRTTAVPSSLPSCGGAVLAHTSNVVTGGSRFDRIFDKSNYASVRYSTSLAATDLTTFRCDCLTSCKAASDCHAVTIVNSSGKLFCYGVKVAGKAKAATYYSESWTV